MVKTDDPRISYVLVALPIFHILSTTLFLWAYCTGFGCHIEAHIAASDLFASSVRDMVPVYLITLVWPTLLFFLIKPVSKSPEFENDGDRYEYYKTSARYWRMLFWSLQAVSVTLVVSFVVQWRRIGITPYNGFYTVFCLEMGMLVGYLRDKYGLKFSQSQALFILATFFAAALAQGLTKGQRDRSIKYQEAASSYTRCSNIIIIRRIGEYYIAIRPDNSRVLISYNCELRDVIP